MKNVLPFSPSNNKPTSSDERPFEVLTTKLILARHQAGALPREVVEALLAGVGLQP